MPRILIAECKQEVSSFNPASSHYADFRIVRGERLLAHHRGVCLMRHLVWNSFPPSVPARIPRGAS
ncbi:MAG: M81 family metallopeptidase [Planctomycetota bacterium]|nr:M81 family metallopeptidase [Planctomycetota bacterium]